MNQELPTVSYCNRTSSNAEWIGGALGQQAQPWEQNEQLVRLLLNQNQIEESNQMANRRIVQVIIADVNDNVPLDSCVLHKGTEKLTDATDQELFFETNISEILKTHNEKRVKWLDKEATKRSGRDVFLEPAKIRELKMVVVTIAQL